MNILYIGPYYENSIIGMSSRDHIDILKKNHNLYIKPIFLTQNLIINKDIKKLENSSLAKNIKYDIIIQYAPIDFIVPFKLIGIKNYCIPIIPYTYSINNKNKYVKNLLLFDKIFVDSKYDSDIIKEIGIDGKKIKIFSYSENIEDFHTYNSDDINKTITPFIKNKYVYYIHSDDIRTISAIIFSFANIGKKIKDCYLNISITNKLIENKIKDMIDLIVSKSKIPYLKNYIAITSIDKEQSNILSQQKNSSCFIDIRTYTNTGLPSIIARHNNKNVIDNESLSINYSSVDSEYKHIFQIQYPEFNIHDMTEKMKSSFKVFPVHKENYFKQLDGLL